MQVHLMVLAGFIVFHLGAVNRIRLFVYSRKKDWLFLAPRDVLVSKEHLLGLASILAGWVLLLTSVEAGLLDYGIFPATFLVLLDVLLIFRALKRYS